MRSFVCFCSWALGWYSRGLACVHLYAPTLPFTLTPTNHGLSPVCVRTCLAKSMVVECMFRFLVPSACCPFASILFFSSSLLSSLELSDTKVYAS